MSKMPKKDETLVIMDELRNLLDLPSDEERKELERNLIEDGGPRDPLVIWDEENAIIDGHNRYGICKAHDLPYKTVRKSFKDIAQVKEWMLRNQLGRRNLSPVRFTYYMGTLYNLHKQDTGKREKMDETTAEKIGKQFQVSERTVRRAGDEVKGIDAVGRVFGAQTVADKIAAIKAKNEEAVSFTKEELAEIGKVPEPEVQEEAVKELVKIKKESAPVRAKSSGVKNISKSSPPAKDKLATYAVAFCQPEFEAVGYNPATELKPPLKESAMVYMVVPDEELQKGMELIKRWGLNYECSFVFHIDGYDGMWSDIRHTFLLVASKGTMIGPNKSAKSIHMEKGDTIQMMMKLIESYHPSVPKNQRIDMRKKNSAEGWEKLMAA